MSLLFATVLVLPSLGYSRGGEETNGGDGVVAEFYAVFDHIIDLFPEQLHYSDTTVFTRQDLQKIRMSIATTSAPSLYLNDKEVMAINRPFTNPPSIVISQKSWKDLNADAKQKLVLHEVLPIMGYHDQDYSYSSWISQRIFLPETDGKLTSLQALRACRREAIQSLTWAHLQKLTSQYSQSDILNAGLYQGCSALYARLFEIGIPANTCIAETSDEMQFSTGLSFMIRKLKQEPEIFWESNAFKTYLERMIQLGADPKVKCHENDMSACDHYNSLKAKYRPDDSFAFLERKCF
ncbi:hypothetical protein [Bdellovibrio sp.]|uniref:hypothetical protein n=1 Tax=Bdellovibrio sp. TaxID=28201 RepID=UPI0039E5FBD8